MDLIATRLFVQGEVLAPDNGAFADVGAAYGGGSIEFSSPENAFLLRYHCEWPQSVCVDASHPTKHVFGPPDACIHEVHCMIPLAVVPNTTYDQLVAPGQPNVFFTMSDGRNVTIVPDVGCVVPSQVRYLFSCDYLHRILLLAIAVCAACLNALLNLTRPCGHRSCRR
jgi:hypothetical protein